MEHRVAPPLATAGAAGHTPASMLQATQTSSGDRSPAQGREIVGQILMDAIRTEPHHDSPGLLVLGTTRFQAGYPCGQSLQHTLLCLLGCFESHNTGFQV